MRNSQKGIVGAIAVMLLALVFGVGAGAFFAYTQNTSGNGDTSPMADQQSVATTPRTTRSSASQETVTQTVPVQTSQTSTNTQKKVTQSKTTATVADCGTLTAKDAASAPATVDSSTCFTAQFTNCGQAKVTVSVPNVFDTKYQINGPDNGACKTTMTVSGSNIPTPVVLVCELDNSKDFSVAIGDSSRCAQQ